MDLARLAERQFGLVTTVQLRSAGVSDRAISHRVAAGSLIRVHRGVYRVPGAPFVKERTILAAHLAIAGSVVSHRSAAVIWSMTGIRAVRPEVIARTAIEGMKSYRVALRPSDTTRRGPFLVTKPSRTLVDLASVIRASALEIAFDDSVTRGLTRLADVEEQLHRAGRRPGIATLRRTLDDRTANGTPGSILETTALGALRNAGLPRPISQLEIRRSDGSFVARPDLTFPEIRLAIEIDGDRYHATKEQRRKDRERQNRLTEEGYAFLRFDERAVKNGDFVRSVSTYLRLT